MTRPAARPLILASQSRYRRELVERLQIDFSCVTPAIDESVQQGESPDDLAERLAREKAQKVAATRHDAVIIGSDQVATRGETILRKPGNHATAHRQLLESSDQAVSFYTAVCVIDPVRGTIDPHLDHTRVYFRSLHGDEIERYLQIEKPFDCAGAFKAECLGISLFRRIESDDPTALQGLPMIWLASALRRCGYPVP